MTGQLVNIWVLLYMLLSFGYVILAFYGRFARTIPQGEEPDITIDRALHEIGRNEPFIVWTGSTLAFFLIYGAWKIWA